MFTLIYLDNRKTYVEDFPHKHRTTICGHEPTKLMITHKEVLWVILNDIFYFFLFKKILVGKHCVQIL